MAINFVLRTKRKNGRPAPLSVLIRDKKHGINCLVKTPILVSVDKYPSAKSSKQFTTAYNESEEGVRVAQQIHDAKVQITTAINDGVTTSEGFMEYINNKLVVAEGHAANDEANRKKKSMIISYFDRYIKRVLVNKAFKVNGEIYSDSCKQQFQSTRRSLAEFIGEDSTLTFGDIDIEFYENWLASMRSHNLTNSTINVYFSYMRRVINRALEEKVTNNAMAAHVFHNVSGDEKYRQALLTLSSEEIASLLSMKLDGVDDDVRNLFCVGFECGQRWSDYGDLDKDQFYFEDNILYLRVEQVKTGKTVVTPILDQRIVDILKRYNFNMPRINRYTFETHIKSIFARLAKSVDTLNEEVYSIQTSAQKTLEASWKALREKKLKGEKFTTSECIVYNKAKRIAELHHTENTDKLWKRDKKGHICRLRFELASSHVARRSRITDLLYQGFTKDEVATVSGHTSESNLNKYDKRVEEIKARLLARKMLRKKAGENISELRVG